ncbi:Cof-type HAD-IIB family hydrolase [Bilifractor sp. LCP21S3_A7]|uniref:Cof-type HAD-IIB family hydrolase n=1 Tax=Bilifractor sp. LCP21S3_A7 TaxID=3438738 RepID=UPI003F92D9A6
MKKLDKKMVFLDIDGTLTNFRGELPESAEYALREAAERGHDMVICSGRTYAQIYAWIREGDLFQGIVSGAGTVVRSRGEIVFRRYVEHEKTSMLLDYLDEIGSLYFLQGDSGIYCPRDRREEVLQLFGGTEETLEEKSRLLGRITFTDAPKDSPEVNKFVFYGAGRSIRQMQEDLGKYFTVVETSFKLGDTVDGEITMNGYDKAFGMQRYLDANGGRREDTIAFGDGPNDFEMLDYAQVGVAMGNALPALKKTADLVTDPVDEDGLMHAFQKLGLIL